MNTIGYLIMFQYTNTYFFGSDSLEQSWESPVSLNLAEFGTGASLRNIFICFKMGQNKCFQAETSLSGQWLRVIKSVRPINPP